jgi:hypothetical protein
VRRRQQELTRAEGARSYENGDTRLQRGARAHGGGRVGVSRAWVPGGVVGSSAVRWIFPPHRGMWRLDSNLGMGIRYFGTGLLIISIGLLVLVDFNHCRPVYRYTDRFIDSQLFKFKI